MTHQIRRQSPIVLLSFIAFLLTHYHVNISVKIDHWHCKIAVVNFLITYAIETIYGETIFYHLW